MKEKRNVGGINKKVENKKRKIDFKLIVLIILCILVLFAVLTIVYINVVGLKSKLKINLNDKKKITIEVKSEYKEKGATASYEKKNISKDIKIKGKVNTSKLGEYKVIYKIKYKKVSKEVERIVKVVDTTKPEITLTGGDTSIYVGNEYKDDGYTAVDNYDGDLTSKVEVSNNINKDEQGEYEVTYKVKDTSGNETVITRKVSVINKPKKEQKVAVLNYHFFYDEDKGEYCDENICERVSDFRSHLDYLRDNGFKTLTMKEFRDWMYGEIEIPEKSVLITVDDGALGTGKHNGNKLIPLLEEYKMHATLFLITGWWDISNYQSKYLDVQSHTNDMHKSGLCSAFRGAQILCSSDEQVRNDLRRSIEVTNSKLSFCFPFYAYSAHAIDLVKEAGFELAFIGGGTKASRNDDKWHIPRFPIQKTTSLETFKSYVN